MAMLLLNGQAIKSPSEFEFSLYAVNSPDAGRDMDGLMYIEKITEKRTIGLAWLALKPSEAYEILNAFLAQHYFQVTYCDPAINADESGTTTKTFYLGDVSAPVKTWTANNKRYANLTFNIIER